MLSHNNSDRWPSWYMTYFDKMRRRTGTEQVKEHEAQHASVGMLPWLTCYIKSSCEKWMTAYWLSI